MNDSALLKIDSLSKQFGGLMAVDNVCLEVEKGAIYGLIGPNGAGKTTIFNLITGVIKPSHGSIVFNGKNIAPLSAHTIAQMGISRTFQNIKLFGNLSVLDNVITVSQNGMSYNIAESFLHGKRFREQEKAFRERALHILDSVGIAQYADTKSSNLPYGLQRRAEIARALGIGPSLLLLDEPAAGMNEQESNDLVHLIRKLRDEYDLTIIIIDHHMEMMMSLCDKITVLHFGKMLATGIPSEIQQNPQVIDAYLGVE